MIGITPEVQEVMETVVAGGCSESEYVAEAMQVAAACGGQVPQPNANGQYGRGASCGLGGRKTVLGSPLTTQTASQNNDISITVRLRGGNTFVGRRLMIPAEYASSVRVAAVKCDADDVLPSADPIPGEVFSTANQRGGELPFLPVKQNSTITITLTNETTAAITNCVAIEGVVF